MHASEDLSSPVSAADHVGDLSTAANTADWLGKPTLHWNSSKATASES